MAKDNSKITREHIGKAGADSGALNAMGAYSITDFKEQSGFIKATENNLLKSFTEVYRQRTKLATSSYEKEYKLRLNFENEILKRQIATFKLQHDNIDKQQQKQLRNLEKLSKTQFDYAKNLEEELDKERNKNLDNFNKKITSTLKTLTSIAAFTPIYHTLMTSYGKLDIKGSLQKGAQSAYDFRGQYGMFGKETLTALANTITQSYKDMKSKGIVIDPTIMREQLQELRNIVNINTTNTAQLQGLITASSQIKAMGGSLNTTTLGTQSLNQMYGPQLASDIQATILSTLQGTYTNLSEATIAKFYNDNMFTARVMSEFKSDDAIRDFYADLTQTFGGVSEVLGSAGASIISDAMLQYMGTNGTDLAKLATFASQSGIGIDFRDTDALLRDLPKLTAGFYEISQQFAGLNLDSPEIASRVVGKLGGSMSVDQIKMMQALGESYSEKYKGGEPLTGEEFESILKAETDKTNATQAQLDSYRQLVSDKYTQIDKDNISLQMAAWESSTDYQNVTKEQLSTIIGYAMEIGPAINDVVKAIWGSGLVQSGSSALLKTGIGQKLAGVVASGVSAIPAAAPAAGSLASLLSVAGPIALGLGVVTAAVVATDKSIKASISETGGYYNQLIDQFGGGGGDEDPTGTNMSEDQVYASTLVWDRKSNKLNYSAGTLVTKKEAQAINSNNQKIIEGYKTQFDTSDPYSMYAQWADQAGYWGNDDLASWEGTYSSVEEMRDAGLDRYLDAQIISGQENLDRNERANTIFSTSLYNIYKNLGLLPTLSDKVDEAEQTEIFNKHYEKLLGLALDGYYVSLNDWDIGFLEGYWGSRDSLQNPIPFDYALQTDPSFLTDLFQGSSANDIPENASWNEILKHLDLHYAKGLSNVPYNGMPALLHQGEMVIPASRANYIRALLGQKPVSTSGGAFEDILTGSNGFVQSIPKYVQGQGPAEGTIGYYAAGDDALSFAYRNVGVPYSKMDCSDMVSQSYRTGAGLGVSDQTAGGIGETWPGQGFSVLYRGDKLAKDDLGQFGLKPGDVLLYKLDKGRAGRFMNISHASLYVDPSTQIHSTPRQGGVRTSGLWDQVVSILRYGSGGSGDTDFSQINSTYEDTNWFSRVTGGGVGGFTLDSLSPFMHIPMVAAFVEKYGQYFGSSTNSTNTGGVADYVSDNKGFNLNIYSPLLSKYASIPNVDPRLLYGMMMSESSGDPNANRYKSSKYKGLMQMSQSSVNEYLGIGHNVFDPETNIKAAAYHLNRAINKVKYTSLGIGGYNAGWNYDAWQTARHILDDGGDWSSILSKMNDVGNKDELMKGNPNNIKTSYINSVYEKAQIPLKIPYLEDGGIVGTDGIYRLAEKNKSEAVIPLENNKDSLGIETLGDNLLDGMDSAAGHLVDKLETMISLLTSISRGISKNQSAVQAQNNNWRAAITSFNGVR